MGKMAVSTSMDRGSKVIDVGDDTPPDQKLAIAKLDSATKMLAEVRSAPEAKRVADTAAAAMAYARKAKMGANAVEHADEIRMRAWRLWRKIYDAGDKDEGGRPTETPSELKGVLTLEDMGVSYKESHEAKKLAELPDDEFELVATHQKKLADSIRDMRRLGVQADLDDIDARQVKEASGVYDVVVIDPPWSISSIENDVRPNHVGLAYPAMSIDEIAALEIPTADDCHVWVWTTQRFLPDAFRLIESWGLRYSCTFVWHKPGGPQPHNLPQFNCEFALYCRKGKPTFLDTKALPTCFEAPRGKHSEKPEAFYDVVRRITAGRRLDMFNRRKIDGFDGWGNEAVSE